MSTSATVMMLSAESHTEVLKDPAELIPGSTVTEQTNGTDVSVISAGVTSDDIVKSGATGEAKYLRP